MPNLVDPYQTILTYTRVPKIWRLLDPASLNWSVVDPSYTFPSPDVLKCQILSLYRYITQVGQNFQGLYFGLGTRRYQYDLPYYQMLSTLKNSSKSVHKTFNYTTNTQTREWKICRCTCVVRNVSIPVSARCRSLRRCGGQAGTWL